MLHTPPAMRILMLAWALTPTCAAAATEPANATRRASDDRRLQAVVAFADNVLAKGRDRWSGKNTPLFADGVNVDTGDPVEWVFRGRHWVVSNLASQQNLFRTLTGLSRLTGKPKYRAAAEAATLYHLDHLRDKSGLLYWGGHRFIDLRTLKVVGEQNSHELKCSYPLSPRRIPSGSSDETNSPFRTGVRKQSRQVPELKLDRFRPDAALQ